MNPYKIDGPATISFSGGRTSGFMLKKIIDAHGGTLPPDVLICFANTGLEHSATLDFVHEVATRWPVNLVWLEYRYEAPDISLPEPEVVRALREAFGEEFEVTAKPLGKHTFAIVNYETASRDGKPFKMAIQARKFLPNPVMRFCTAELKIKTIARYSRSVGFEHWDSIIGLRADEPRRVAKSKAPTRERWTNVMPIAEAGHVLKDVRDFWRNQPFDLNLPDDWDGWGNCVGCFLKARHKLEHIALQAPWLLEWWASQEENIGTTETPASARFRADRPNYRQMLTQVRIQGRLAFSDPNEEDIIPCACTD